MTEILVGGKIRERMKTQPIAPFSSQNIPGSDRRLLSRRSSLLRLSWRRMSQFFAAMAPVIAMVFPAVGQMTVTGPNDPHLNFTGVFPGAEYYGGWNAGTLQIGNASFVQNESRVPNSDYSPTNLPNFGSSAQDVAFAYMSDRSRFQSGGAAQNFTITVVPNRTYLAQFFYHDSQSGTVGQRIFDVVFNGVVLATNMDLVALGANQTNAVDVVLTNIFTSATGSVSYSAVGSAAAGGVGNALLCAATLQDIGSAPFIYLQPTNAAINDGNSAQFSVISAGTNVTYQWQACASGTGAFTNLTDTAGYVSGSLTPNLMVSIPTGTVGNTDFQVIISNSAGVVTSSIATLTVTSAALALTQDISTTPAAVAGYPFSFVVNATGSGPISYQWQSNGVSLSDGGRISGSHSNVLTIANVQPSDAANYQAIVTGANSNTVDSSIGNLQVTNTIGIYDGSTWTLNGNTNGVPTLSGGILTMTTLTNNEARTAFFNLYPVNVDSFHVSYVYQDVDSGGADGVSFILQNSERGLAALGATGGSEGFQLNAGAQGVAPAVGFLEEVFNNEGFGLSLNGQNFTYGASTLPAMLGSGDPILVNIWYSSRVYAFTLTDQLNGNVFNTEYNTDLGYWLSQPGGPRAHTATIGFGGGTGSSSALQQVSQLTYGPNPYSGNPLVITNWNDPQFDTTGNSLGHFVIAEYYGETSFGTQTMGNANFVLNDNRFTTEFGDDIVRNTPNFGSSAPQKSMANICSELAEWPNPFTLPTIPGHKYELQLFFHDNFYGVANRNARQFAVQAGSVVVPFIDLADIGACKLTAAAALITNCFTASTNSIEISFTGFRDRVVLNALTLVDETITPGFETQPTNQVLYSGSSAQLVSLASGEGPITYQWQARAGGTANSFTNVLNGPNISGATTNVLNLADLAPGNTDFQVIALNPYGSITSSIANITVETSAPVLTGDISPLAVTVPTNYTFGFTANFVGSTPMQFQWLHNGSPMSNSGRVSGAQSNVLTIASAQAGDAGTYEVLVTNSYGNSNSSIATVTITNAPLGFLDGTAWALNDGSSLTSGVLEITDGSLNEGRSAFFDYPVSINAFTASFTYQDVTGGGADGTAFVLQNDPRRAAAVGGTGGTLGYGTGPGSGITNSVAFEMDIFTPGVNLETNGIFGNYVSTSPNINLSSGDLINVNIVYQQGLMVVTMTDANTLLSVTNTYSVNVANVVGGPTAYIGFTGGSGAAGAVQDISNFTFGSLPASKPTIQQNLPASVSQPVGLSLNLGVLATGTTPLYYLWYFNGTNLVNGSRITGATTNNLNLAYTTIGDIGNYDVIVSNFYGTATSSVANVTITGAPLSIGNGTSWSFNGGASLVSSGTVQLTDGNYNEAQSSFFDTPVDIDAFKASFTYQDLTGPSSADGLAFVLQNSPAGPDALGQDDGGLGFSGITPSVALAFNLYSGEGVGMAFETNSLSYIFGGNSAYISTAPVSFNSGDLINVTMTYADGIVSVTLTDQSTLQSYTANYAAYLPGLLGGHTAYVGFTGGTGAITSQQQVSNFSFINLASLDISRSQSNSAVLSWPVAMGAYTLLENSSLTTTNWVPATNAVTVTGNLLNQVTIPGTGTNEFFELINQE